MIIKIYVFNAHRELIGRVPVGREVMERREDYFKELVTLRSYLRFQNAHYLSQEMMVETHKPEQLAPGIMSEALSFKGTSSRTLKSMRATYENWYNRARATR